MNMNGANDYVLTLNAELKAQERILHTFDNKVDLLEQAYHHHSDKLDDIEHKLCDMDRTLEKIKDLISQHEGSKETKAKIKNSAYMIVTVAVTFLATVGDITWKLFGN